MNFYHLNTVKQQRKKSFPRIYLQPAKVSEESPICFSTVNAGKQDNKQKYCSYMQTNKNIRFWITLKDTVIVVCVAFNHLFPLSKSDLSLYDNRIRHLVSWFPTAVSGPRQWGGHFQNNPQNCLHSLLQHAQTLSHPHNSHMHWPTLWTQTYTTRQRLLQLFSGSRGQVKWCQFNLQHLDKWCKHSCKVQTVKYVL